MNPAPCSCSIADLEFLDIEQALAFSHNGYVQFMRDFYPRLTVYGNTKENLFSKKELLTLMKKYVKRKPLALD